MAPRIFALSFKSRRRSASDSHGISSKTIFNDLSDAHASNTGARHGNLPALTPGWAGDQPVAAANAKSRPLASVARLSPPSLSQFSEAPHTHLTPSGPPPIPENEIGVRFPSLSREGSSIPASGIIKRKTEQHQSSAGYSHRRSRSLDQLLSTADTTDPAANESGMPLRSATLYPLVSAENETHEAYRNVGSSLPQNSTVSDIYDSYIGEEFGHHHELRRSSQDRSAFGNAPMYGVSSNLAQPLSDLDNYAWSPRSSLVNDMPQTYTNTQPYVESQELPGAVGQTHDNVGRDTNTFDSTQASVARTTAPEISDHDSFESFQAFLNGVQNQEDSESEEQRQDAPSATLTLVHQHGPVSSRPMSQAEIMGLEQQIRLHLRNPSRLSTEYVDESNVNQTVAVRASRSSSSTSFGTFHLRRYGNTVQEATGAGQHHELNEVTGIARTRTGTPPLLFGSNALGQPHVLPLGSSERDWETVDGAAHDDFHAQGGVSSFADYSSSSSEMRARGLPPGGRILQHPAHPRYAHTWNMMRDARTGQTLLLPEDSAATSPFPYQNAVTPPAMRQRLFADYQHFSPSSAHHGYLFGSPPVSSRIYGGSPSADESRSLLHPPGAMDPSPPTDTLHEPHYAVSEHASIIGYESDENLEIAGGSEQDIGCEEKKCSDQKDQSSAWVSTEDGALTDHFVSSRAREGSFAQMMIANAQANITGTPEGTGVREVGSSLANASSPSAAFSSSPIDVPPATITRQIISDAEKRAHRRTIDGSLDAIRTKSSDELFKQFLSVPGSKSSTYSADEEFTALPQASSILPIEVIEHRQQLINHNLLPRPKTPPYSEPKRLSLPLDSLTPSKLKKDTVATGANFGRQLQQFLPSSAIVPTIRKRSPHRPQPTMDPGPSDFELQVTHPRKSKKSARGKGGRKRKVSDSEEVTDPINGSTTAPAGHGFAAEHEPPVDSMTTSIEPVELEGVTVHPTTAGAAGADLDNHKNVTQRVDTPTTTPFRVDNEYKRSRLKNHEWDLLYIDLPGHESATERVGRPPQRPRPRPAGATYGTRPIARAQSPHLYPIPRTPEDNLLARQKELGRVFLVLCAICPALWLLYGHGYLDYMMDGLTCGACRGMRKEEKRIALILGYGTVAAVAIGISVGVVVHYLGGAAA